MVCKSLFVPICVKKVVYNGEILGMDILFQHTLKSNKETCHIQTENLSYIHNIDRSELSIPSGTWWQFHPKYETGKGLYDYMTGSIVLITSTDSYVLLVRNNQKWGFPKGARYFLPYKKLVDKTIMHFTKTHNILWHDELVIDSTKPEQQESALDNAYREVLEETGIDCSKTLYTQFVKSINGYDTFHLPLPCNASEYYEKYLLRNGTDTENDEIRWVLWNSLFDKSLSLNKITNDMITQYWSTQDLLVL